jgi:hypothetical protein
MGNRNRNLPACSIVPQATEPPRTPQPLVVKCSLICGKSTKINELKINHTIFNCFQGHGFVDLYNFRSLVSVVA